jgi:hypothetical protein
MASTVPDEERAARLRRQRNLFAAIAALAVASIGLAVPRRVASHRELHALNARLVELQYAIVDVQRQIRDTQGEIVRAQDEIKKRGAK